MELDEAPKQPDRAGNEVEVREARSLYVLPPASSPAGSPGAAFVAAFTWGGKVQVAVSLYFYGDRAAQVAAQEEEVWTGWLGEKFPIPAEAPAAAT